MFYNKAYMEIPINYDSGWPILCAQACLHDLWVKVYSGSVLQMNSYDISCIVNAANERLEHGGGLAGQIAYEAGEDFTQECVRYIKKYKLLAETKPLTTCAGKLPFKKVIHIVGPIVNGGYATDYHKRSLKESVKNCIIEAQDRKLESLAIPGISCGTFGFPKKDAAFCHFQGFSDAANILQKNVKEVRMVKEVCFVLFTKDELEAFVDEFKKRMEMNEYEYSCIIGIPEEQSNCNYNLCGGCSRIYEINMFSINSCCLVYCNYCVYRYNLTNCLKCRIGSKQLSKDNPMYCLNTLFIYCRKCKIPQKRESGCCLSCFNICAIHTNIGSKCTYCDKIINPIH